MKTLKEKKLIVRMQRATGEEVDQKLLDEIAEEEAKLQAVSESRKTAFQSMFTDLSKDIGKLIADEKKKTAEEEALLNRFNTLLTRIDEIKQPEPVVAQEEVIVEEVFPEQPVIEPIEEKSAILAPVETPTLAKAAAERIKADTPPSMFVQPEPATVSKDVKDIQQKLKLLEGWVSKISMAGPGGGAVWLRDLDDVSRSSVLAATDGQVLTYNETTKLWVAADPATGNGGSGYVLPTASTTVKGGVKIDGTTITISNQVISSVTNVDWLHVPSSIIPNTSLTYSLGNNTNRWESMWVGGNSITFTDQTTGFPDQKLTLADGVFYIAIANTTQQSNAGLRVGNFLLQNNYIQLTDSNATFYIGSTLATGNLVINRPVVMNSPDTGKTTFTVARSGRVQIFVPTIPAGDVGGLSIIGSANGNYQGIVNPGGMLHITGNDGVVSRITNDAFGANVFPAYVSRAGRGTANTPTAIQSGDILSRYSTVGWGTTSYAGGSSPAATNIEVIAKENFTDTAGGTEYRIYTAPIGTTTKTLALRIDNIGITANNANLTYITANGSVGTNTQVLASNGTGIYWTNATAGATGANGANGISVTSANVNSNGYLIITYSNTATANAGYVVGPAGANGSNVSQIQTDWNQSNVSAIDFIKNKPTIPTNLDSLTDVTITGPLNNQVLTYNTALSQWINQNGTSNNFTTGYFGGFIYTGANVALSNTANAYLVPLTSSQGASGVSIGSNNDIVFAYAGTYELCYSIQIENDANDDDYADVWILLNGANLDDTNSIFAVNRKNTGNHPGDIIAVTPFQLTLAAGDKIQVMVSSSTGSAKIVTIPAQTTPAVPRTPGVIVNVQQVSSIVIPDNIAGTANNTSFVGSVSAANVVSNSQLQSNLANYQTTSGLSANVAKLSANNASYLGTVAADQYLTLSGTQTVTNKTFTSPYISTSYTNLTVPEMGYTTNSTYAVDHNALSATHAGAPFSLINWHDEFAFGKLYPTITYESYNGTAWSNGTLNKQIFAQQQWSGGTVTPADGTTTFGGRWTFTGGVYGGTSYGQGVWLVIGHAWNSGTAPVKQVKVESSTDGSTWTTRHTSQYQTTMASVYHRVGDYSGDQYLRVTITWVSGNAINLANMLLLSARAGDQGYGREFMYPYVWDKDQNITANANLAVTGVLSGTGTSQNVFNTTATTINFGGAATTINIGAATGTTTVKNTLAVSNTTTVTYTPASTTGVAITATGKDTQGGTGYFDFLRATNTTSGVTNGNKTFRLNSTGSLEVINSAYSTTLLSLSDTGALSVPGPISISGKQAVNGPAFSAYANNTLQTITSGSLQKVLFQVEEFDTNSNYASSKFTPTVEGYYQLNAEVRLDGASGTGEMMIVLYKNGSAYKRGTNQQGTQIATNFWAMQVSSVVYANGTTDYFEIYVQQGSGGNVTVTAVNDPSITWFNGCMLRGA